MARWEKGEGYAALPRHGSRVPKPPPVREPLGHHRNRSRIPKTVADPAQHSKTNNEVVQAGCVGTKEEPHAYQQATRHGNPERPKLILQPPGEDERNREHDHRPPEHGGRVCPLPPELFLERPYEHPPSLQQTKAEVPREPPHHP